MITVISSDLRRAGQDVRRQREAEIEAAVQLEIRAARETGDSICVYDFAGTIMSPGRWADWQPATGVIQFGGFWHGVPAMTYSGETLPTEAAIETWAKFFLGYLQETEDDNSD